MSESKLTKEEIEEIQLQGANSYAISGSKGRNPFYKSENMPAQTGEEIEVWNLKADAWEFGFEMERFTRN